MPRVMEITTPLGDDVLLFHGMHAREEMGRLSEFQIDLLSAKNDVDPDAILGKNVTVKLALPDDTTRYFNGFVTRFAQGGSYGRYIRYSAVVRSWLWFLTRTTDCRIFQEMTVPDIVKKVFGDHSTADFKLELTGTYRKWNYCVQYRETDFNFVSRLLEEEGIYYYVRHTDGHNTVVLTDSTSKHAAAPGYETIPFVAPEQLVKPELEHISRWDFSRQIQPGVYVHDDYDLERPSVELKTRKVLSRGYAPSDYEIYDYPGHYLQKADGEQYAGVRIDEFGSQFETAQGSTNAKGILVGSLFTLDSCPREDQNTEHLILAASYDLEFSDYEAMPEGSGTSYRCSFVAMSSKQQFRPKRATPKPFVQGPQTAMVVGPAGDEIYTDKYGRVKVQFHWDRYGKKDENSSCWIRVSSPWAGKAWGTISTPRIGQEVIVDFLEGDPDQPIITGRVYNAEQMPPYDLPANKTQSGMKSRSSTGGGPANFNEIRFEDKAGSEQLFIHAEKNQDIEVEKDETHLVGHDRTKTIDHDETSHIKHNRTETVDNNETITVHANRTEEVDANETILIGGSRSIMVSKSETATVALQRTHTVGVNETITVGAAQEVTVGGLQAITVGAQQSTSVGGAQSTSVGGSRSVSAGGSQATAIGANATMTIGKDEERNVSGARQTNIGKDETLKIGKNLTIEAGDAILIHTGDASISMKKDGTILIKGKDITIQGSGKINAKADGDIVMKGSKITQN
jgi:type VI secretion system secreted protein VgrG